MYLEKKQFETIKNLLELHGYNDIHDYTIKERIIQFQNKKNLTQDGILGPNTLWELQYEPTIESEKLTFQRVEVDKYMNSYKVFRMRSDVAPALRKVYKQMKALGSILPSSGGHRNLYAKVSKGRSATSFHYTGLAMDIFIWAGLQDLEDDPFILTYVKAKQMFNVYARSDNGVIPYKKMVAKVFENDKLVNKTTEGRFYSLTQLMSDNGFTPIRVYSKFHEDPNKNYLLSEWWHFQNNTVLTPLVSQFGIELLKVYPLDKLNKTPVWAYRKAIFEKNGFYSNIEKFLK